LARIFYNSEERLAAALPLLERAYELGPEPPEPRQLIRDRIA